MSSEQMGFPEQRQLNFGAPSAVNVEVLGTDNLTAQGFTLVGEPGNIITRIFGDAPTAASKYQLIMKRDGKEVRRWSSDLLKSTLQGPVWQGFPLAVRGGQIQFYLTQDNGTPEAHTVFIMWANSLIPVMS